MIDFLSAIFLHLDHTLPLIFQEYGVATCGILFVVIFCETGLIFFPFLPGDSLLFAAGVLCANSTTIPVFFLWVLLGGGAILGDSLNYIIGKTLGKSVIVKSRFIKQSHLDKAKEYFETKGQKSIILARFLPIFRTFVPFVAGMSGMSYRKFSVYNIVGGIVWTGSFLLAGYFFAHSPVVKDHFSTVILAIMIISFIPPVWDCGRAILKKIGG